MELTILIIDLKCFGFNALVKSKLCQLDGEKKKTKIFKEIYS